MLKRLKGISRKHLAGWLTSLLAAWLLSSDAARLLTSMPDSIHLTRGYSAQLELAWPIRADIQGGAAALSSLDESLAGSGAAVRLSGQETGVSALTLKVMGFWPVRVIPVQVEEEKILVPGGLPVGVAIRTQGVLVVGASDLGGSTVSPAREAGLLPGDLIQRVDGVAVTGARHLSSLISSGKTVELTIVRGDAEMTLALTPARDPRDGAYRLGAWVRDSTAGIGTLSFYDPDTGRFGALGHAITDIDTGRIMSVQDGEIILSDITQIHRGEKGAPGELVGQFDGDSLSLGRIDENGVFGIYGSAAEPISNSLYPQGVPILSRDEVRVGPAQILTTLDGEGVRAYDCEILRLAQQSGPAQRSMVIRVTDPELLDRTGGIVQGMSGSPILQDGRLAGAVTHVYVNDPTTGYGLYIDWMLEAAGQGPVPLAAAAGQGPVPLATAQLNECPVRP